MKDFYRGFILLAIGSFLMLFLHNKLNPNKKSCFRKKVKIAVTQKMDSIKKTIKLDSIKNSSIKLEPEIVEVEVVNPTNEKLEQLVSDLQKELNGKLDSIYLLKKLLEAKTVRTYKDTYKDSLVEIDYEAKVEGQLLESSLSYLLKEREVPVYEKTIVKTVIKEIDNYLYTRTLNAGLLYTDELFATLKYKDARDWTYGIGISTKGSMLFEASIPILRTTTASPSR